MLGMYVKIAWRNVFRNRRRSFVVIGSVSAGMAGAIFMIMFMSGMAKQMVHAAINSYLGHVQIHRTGFADNPVVRLTMTNPDSVTATVDRMGDLVAGYTPRVLSRGLAQSATNSGGVQIVGTDAVREAELTSIVERIVEGTFLTGKSSRRRKEIVIGDALAQKLGVRLRKKVVLLAQAKGGEIGSAAFRVVGIFKMPSDDLNKTLVWINVADAQELLGIGRGLSEVMVKLADDEQLDAVRCAIAAGLSKVMAKLTDHEQFDAVRDSMAAGFSAAMVKLIDDEQLDTAHDAGATGLPEVVVRLTDDEQLGVVRDAIAAGHSEVMVKLTDHGQLGAASDTLIARLGGDYEVRTWKDASKQMVDMVELFDISVLIMMVIIFFAAAFGIINTMLMSVFERMREFGILRAIGTGWWALFRMVVYEAAFIGIIGIVGGVAVMSFFYAIGFSDGLDLSMWEDSLAMFGSDAVIRPYLDVPLFIKTVIIVEAMTVLASVWPAVRATRLQPVDAMRHQ